MAHMYPKRLLDDVSSSAERKLYELFRHKLSDEFTVFHSVAWLASADDGRAQDGEADFLIAHPELGVLVMEVKGGRIELDGPSEQWFSVDRYGNKHLLNRSPYAQAKDGCYRLLRKLRESRVTSAYSYTVGYAVCFPDVVVDDDLRPDAPMTITIDQRRKFELEKTVRSIFDHWRPDLGGRSPTHSGIQALIELLAPRVELRSFLGLEFRDESEQIKQLTQEQFSVLDKLNRERRAVVYGCAGSGKTMLALEKARRLVNEGYAVLFTCYNARLADWLRTTPYAREGVVITHFHKLCSDLASRANVAIPALNGDVVEGNEEYFFGSVLPEALIEATSKLGPQYNALIVDEGQDFIDTWWIALEGLLANPSDDVFYIFCDDNQNIYSGTAESYPFREPHLTLSTNCRNTRSIHQAVVKYYKSPVQFRTGGPEGRPPETVSLTGTRDLIDALRKRLHALVLDEKVAPKDIVVLSPRSARTSVLKEGTNLGNLSLTWHSPTRTNQIQCSTIYSFKGLEKSVVLLVELDHLPYSQRDALMYVALSRAIHHVIYFGSELQI